MEQPEIRSASPQDVVYSYAVMSAKVHLIRSRFAEPLEPRRLLAAGFQISLNFAGDLLDPQYQAYQASFVTAAARWTAILTEDIPDVPAGAWGAAVDDVRIEAEATALDGPGNILGSAQYLYRRSTGARLPINGTMQFDTADLNAASIVDVITHEMGHVLGIGSLWNGAGIVSDYGGSNPTYLGTAALAEYRAIVANASLTSIPLENTGNTGTRDVHWRESLFGRELMTGFYNSGQTNPLSRMSAASLIDLGYPGVNPDATNAYAPSSGNPVPTITSVTPSSSTTSLGGSFTLTANGVSDVFGGVANVRFYRETNGIPGLQASGNVTVKDELISTDSAGSVWSANVTLGSLPAGTYTYYAQASDIHNAISVYVSTTHTVSLLPAAPSVPDLDALSDSGASNSDDITNVNMPTLKGTSGEAAGTTIHVFADGIEIGQTTVAAGSSWTFTSTTALADGVRNITAKAETGLGLSEASGARSITIDTAAPLVASSSFVYATMLGVTFEFNENVSASLNTGDVTFLNTTSSTTQANTYVGSVGNVATFKFVGYPAKGDYIATLTGVGVMDVAGNAMASNPTISFFFLPGDINQSRSVTFDDLLILAQHYGQTGTFMEGDLNYSGAINFDDLLILSQYYGQTLLSARTSGTTSVRTRGNSDVIR